MPKVEDSVLWHDAIQRKGHFVRKTLSWPAHDGVTVKCYSCSANGFWFDSLLATLFCFFFFAFFQAPLRCYV